MEAAVRASTLYWSRKDFNSRPGLQSILKQLEVKPKDSISSETRKKLEKARIDVKATQERWLQASNLKYALKDVRSLARDPLMEDEPKWSDEFIEQLRALQAAILLAECPLASICGPIRCIQVSKDFMDALHRALFQQLVLRLSILRRHVGQTSPKLEVAVELRCSEVEALRDYKFDLRLCYAQCVFQHQKELKDLLDQLNTTPVLPEAGISVLRDQLRLFWHHLKMTRVLVDERVQLYTPAIVRLFKKIELQLDRKINETRMEIQRDRETLEAFREASSTEIDNLIEEYRATTLELQALRCGLQYYTN